MCVCVCARMCVCVCVRERDRGKTKENMRVCLSEWDSQKRLCVNVEQRLIGPQEG